MAAPSARVLQTATTTGTGTLTLGGAIDGYRTLADAVTAGDQTAGDAVPYSIEAVDVNGTPTGAWETGLGTVGAAGGTLSRDVVRASSNAGAAVDFSAGTKYVYVLDRQPPDTDPDFASLAWGTPGAESSDTIEVAGSVADYGGRALATDTVDVEVRVTDGAADAEPSATATLAAAGTPVGTVLAGSGTATLVIRTDASGGLAVSVSEPAAAHRYLWVRQAGHARRWVRAADGVLELVFT